MKYQIINYNCDEKISSHIIEESFLTLEKGKKISVYAQWLDDLEEIYKLIFDIKNNKYLSKLNFLKKSKLSKTYSNVTLVNAYEFLSNDPKLFYQHSTKNKFLSKVSEDINFVSFTNNEEDDSRINSELLASPNDFDEVIKDQTKNSCEIAIIKMNGENLIPYLECYVDNIGTNISSINYDEWSENIKDTFEQTINIGVKFLLNCKKIYVIVDEKDVNNVFVNEKNTVISRILKSHNDVVYMIRKNYVTKEFVDLDNDSSSIIDEIDSIENQQEDCDEFIFPEKN